MEKLHRLSRVKTGNLDSVSSSKALGDGRAFDVLMEAQVYWDNMYKFRRERERNKKYCYGAQWDDLVTVDGRTMTEEEYIKQQGSVPLKSNLIRRLVRNVLGVYRGQSKEPSCHSRDRSEQKLGEWMSTLLQCNMQLNKMDDLLSRSFEEFLISGFVVHRKWYGWRKDQLDCWTDNVDPNNFFIDCNMRDYRGWDVTVLGEVHDISFGELCDKYAKSPGDYARLEKIYSYARQKSYLVTTAEGFGYSDRKNFDFLYCDNPTRCRVIEVWRKELKPRYRCHDYNSGEMYKIEVADYAELVERVNAERLSRGRALGLSEDDIPLIEAEWVMDNYWYYYHLTPFGDILEEGESPYLHKEHPYVFKMYPFIDGEIHSFVNDIIDQQRYVNRLITLYDWIMRASAKGVLVVPEESVGTMSLEDIADEWSRFNGVIAIKTKNGVPMPQQLSSNNTNVGISELLNLQLKFFEDISGVNGALQGKPGFSSTSGVLYAQQTQNATTSLLDMLDTFGSFVIDAAWKDVRLIQQYYDDRRVKEIVGDEASLSRLRVAMFDLSVVESTSTPVYRQLQNDFLMEIWRTGQITLQQLLENGDFPFADSLLQSVQAQQEQLAQGGVPSGIPADLQAQAQSGADMDVVARTREAIGGGA